MKSLALNESNLPTFEKRLASLRSDTAAAWGTMTPIAMCAHLQRTLEVSLGEHPVADCSTLLSRTLLKWIALHHPNRWPRGRVQAPPEALPTPTGDFAAQREALLQTMRRFVEQATAEPRRVARHPMFGPLPLKAWQRFHGNHLNHHLVQFNA